MHKLNFNHQYPKKYLNQLDFYFNYSFFSILKTFLTSIDLQNKDHFQEVKDTLISLIVLITFYFVELRFLQINFLFILLTHLIFAPIMGILRDNIDLKRQTLCLSKAKVSYKLLVEVVIC